MRHRLTSLVLLLAYGLPALCGPAAHILHVCSDVACHSPDACSSTNKTHSNAFHACCHHRHRSDGDQQTASQTDGPARSSVPAWNRLGHDHANCLICRYHSLSVLFAVPHSSSISADLVIEIPFGSEQEPRSRWVGIERTRGPPSQS